MKKQGSNRGSRCFCGTAAGAYVHRRKDVGGTCAKMCISFELVDMPFVWHSDKSTHVHRLRKWLNNGTCFKSLDLSHCCLQNAILCLIFD